MYLGLQCSTVMAYCIAPFVITLTDIQAFLSTTIILNAFLWHLLVATDAPYVCYCYDVVQ